VLGYPPHLAFSLRGEAGIFDDGIRGHLSPALCGVS
jgi:hypothetical protein